VDQFKPTEEQEKVIRAPKDATLLVFAGAGTGKTEALIRRVETLLDDDTIQHGNILVLTFSRAAVRELRNRLRRRENDSKFVKARTFDSFATLLLMNCPKAADLSAKDYDDRILMASEFILSDEDAKNHLKDIKHLILDEMQDLVGVRQLMVRNLIQTLGKTTGFSFFTDPAQSIYDYQVRDRVPRLDAQQMTDWLKSHFNGELVEETFTRDFRFETEEARTALWARDELLGPKPKFQEIRDRLKNDLRRLSTFTLDQRAPGMRRNEVPVAILCRSNAHALLLSRELFRLNLPHTVQREQTDRCLPSWLALVFRGLESPDVSRSEFIQRHAQVAKFLAPDDLDRLWSPLKRFEHTAGKTLNLVTLNGRIRSGSVPDELVQPNNSRIILSTIHRSKGLEYPNVMIADPQDAIDDIEGSDSAEEARILYVAMTRARRSLERLNAPAGCKVGKDAFDRCRLYEFHKGFALVKSFEVRGYDTHLLDPAGGFGFDGKVGAIQDYILDNVKLGDEVELRCADVADEMGTPQKHYVVHHRDELVGITSIEASYAFRTALKPPRASRSFEIKWPWKITGLRVEAIDTVAGHPATSRKHGLGISGLWLRVRVAGLGDLHFNRPKSKG